MRIRALILPLALVLAGCATSNLREDPGAGDLMELRKEAARVYQEHEYAKALPLYQALVERVPNDPYLWFRLGNVQAYLKQPDPAIAAYREAVRLSPKMDKAWHNMAILYLRQAANSLTQMLQHTDPKGVLYPKAVQLSDGVIQLLEHRDGPQDPQ